jgi:hypothetical protein
MVMFPLKKTLGIVLLNHMELLGVGVVPNNFNF